MRSCLLFKTLIACSAILGAASATPFALPAYGQIQVSDTSVGYIDSVVVASQIRFRFDAAYGNNVPDRAEFFYAKCGCFRTLTGALARFRHESAGGPPEIETNVDYQDIRPYLEYAFSKNWSAFVEAPIRFLNPEQNDNTAGFGDMQAGIKLNLLSCDDEALTFQLKTYIPTGDAIRGLGTDHVSIEPGLLFYRRLSNRIILEGEFRDWIPIGGSDFAGNVLRYGFGFSYDGYDCCGIGVRPVAEIVGWTVLDGMELPGPGAPQDATGATIVNIKLGARFGIGDTQLYAGYGRALTGDVWYQDIMRFEFRRFF